MEYGSGGWGLHIERLHQDPWAPRIMYKIERDGCCHPALCQATMCGCIPQCKKGKKRSYLWIMEAGIEANAACFTICNPLACSCCSLDDFVTKVYFDNSAFKPCCCGKIQKGIATEDDMNYCCWCINCVCIYQICTKPCMGGVVALVCVPNESECAYKCATRCCTCCCTSPVLSFVKDSGTAKQQLLAAMRATEARKKSMKGVKSSPSSPQLTSGGGSASPVAMPVAMPMAPQPQTMEPHL